jgi:hypothetical protein
MSWRRRTGYLAFPVLGEVLLFQRLIRTAGAFLALAVSHVVSVGALVDEAPPTRLGMWGLRAALGVMSY